MNDKTGEVNYITEIIPDFDKLPDWAREAFEDGQYFAVVSEKVIAYEAKLEAAEKRVGILEIARDFYKDELGKAEAAIKAISELPDKWREDCCVSIGMVKLAVELKADELQAIIKGNKRGDES